MGNHDVVYALLRKLATIDVQKKVATGEVILPPDYSAQANFEVAKIRAGTRKLKYLKKWRVKRYISSPPFEHVLVFGCVILVNDDGWYCLYERDSEKLIWGKYRHADIYELYALAIHFDLLFGGKDVETLPEPEREGLYWRLSELVWATGQVNHWQIFAGMNIALSDAAQKSKAISNRPL